MDRTKTLLVALGGEDGCRHLAAEFYARVGADPVLRPLFPGKSLRCAIEQFGAFLIQFLGGDERQTQDRWWLSLRESHSRFEIGETERRHWLKHMEAAVAACAVDGESREALRQFFLCSSAYVVGKDAGDPAHEELAARWTEQRTLDETLARIAAGDDDGALALAGQFMHRPAVFARLLARMAESGRAGLVRFALDAVKRDPALGAQCYGGRSLLHYAAGAGCRELVELMLRHGTDPNLLDRGGHTPLYSVANECTGESGPEVVRALVNAGAHVNACGGVTRATALHMAARRGFVEIAKALLDCGAVIDARDSKGDTPLRRAMNCRKRALAELLMARQGTRAR